MRQAPRWLVLVLAVLTIAASACSSGGGGGKTRDAHAKKPGLLGSKLGDDEDDEEVDNPAPAPEPAPATTTTYAPTPTTAPAPVTPGGADSGFRSPANGFSFQNYGARSDVSELVPADMREMYGDAVCSTDSSGRCYLSSPAQSRMETLNQFMAGGHCYGFSVASLLFFKGTLKSPAYGGGTVPALKLEGNTLLQRKLAQAWSAQTFDSVRAKTISGTPNAVLDFLIAHLRSRSEETYTIGIFKRDRSAGHAVTPYGVVDHGGGKVGVLIYDNNHPGKQREILFDRGANAWSYEAATNPQTRSSLYDGDAQTKSLDLEPTLPGVGVQPCPFCGGGTANALPDKDKNKGAAPGGTGLVYLSTGVGASHPRLLLTDPQGRRTGFANGALVEEIPGVTVQFPLLDEPWNLNPEPLYHVPLDVPYSVTIDAGDLPKPTKVKVAFIGQGRNLSVGNIDMAKGQRDVLTLPAGGAQLSYRAGGAESPVFTLGVDNEGADYAFKVKANGLRPGGVIGFDLAGDHLGIDTNGAGGPVTADIGMLRLDRGGVGSYNHKGVGLDTSAARLNYANWAREGTAIPLDVTDNGQSAHQDLDDGSEDETPGASIEIGYDTSD